MFDPEEIFKLMDERSPHAEEKKLIKKAFVFAQSAHEGQKRASGDPYFLHVYETAKNLARFGMDSTTIAAGLLHDVVEDTDIKEKELEKEFGKEIVFLVNGVSKLGKLKYRGHERYVESLRKFFVAVAVDFRVLMIKLADRLHNLNTLEFVRKEKQKRIAQEALEVYAPLADRLGIGKVKGELEDAAFPYVYPNEYQMVEELISKKIYLTRQHLEKISDQLKKILKEHGITISKIDYRIKHKYSLYKKLLRYGMDIDKIHDLVALRIVVSTIEQCYHVLGVIHGLWTPLPGRIKDYIALPKPNGYQSLHSTIFTGKGEIAEVQIRTLEMHGIAEYGIASHSSYKQKKYEKKEITEKKFGWVEGLKELQKNVAEHGAYMKELKMDFFNDRIFVFTPGGDVIDLPEGSSPIDFAYAIHSDVGDHASGAKVNGKMVQLGHKLQNSDIVEIIKKKDSKPSSKWLDYTKTALAKRHIKSKTEGQGSLLSKFKLFGK
ncbi:MAG: PpGpp synthetase/hydrolase Rel [Candidatus Nomurabacteria bacterium GW2011_GWB1_37_5]|uniref:PpGpp synthetase/hydrolase Rel n=1 Tax=Candidatus Nomurabacteria bacterium GW2011_GWB1_37_5 TaxID=1618742 RepID=A0A0G0H809_9BACT|nr:MAG: PpGpp synthetase/hydrolase Rel [Candidatus Nomurabacteria bacterium GW2011_GWB1_37_5]